MKPKTKRTTYKLIPGSQSSVCGVTYVNVTATYSNGGTQLVTMGKAEYELEMAIAKIQDKYSITDADMEFLKGKFDASAAEGVAESQVD